MYFEHTAALSKLVPHVKLSRSKPVSHQPRREKTCLSLLNSQRFRGMKRSVTLYRGKHGMHPIRPSTEVGCEYAILLVCVGRFCTVCSLGILKIDFTHCNFLCYACARFTNSRLGCVSLIRPIHSRQIKEKDYLKICILTSTLQSPLLSA